MEILEYLGKFHPVVLHLPIGALYLTFCLVLLEKFFKNDYTIPVRFGLLFSFVFAIISCLLGYLLSLSGDYGQDILNLHMWLGISTAIFNGFLLWFHYKSIYKKHFISFFTITIILLTVTGHFGGTMTHGEDFLKPPLIKNELVFNTKDSVNFYSEVVRPIIDNKCVKCHNPSKSRGGLLMNNRENLLKGGKSGKIFLANNSLESNLYNYLLLPLDDDLHMPPKGNTQLKQHEIELLKEWIDSGANFEKFHKIQETEDQLIKNLASFFPKPQLIVSSPSNTDIIKLQDLNFRVERNSNENNFIEAKFLGKDFQTIHLNALLKIKEQLIKLDLSHTNLNDNLISKFRRFKNLQYLKINDTDISNKGLLSIGNSIVSLNLNNTKVSYEGLVPFLKKSSAKNIYLWETNISVENQKKLSMSSISNLNFGVSDFSKGVPLSPPKPISEQTMFSDSLTIEFFKPLGNPTIRYTLDDTEPDSLSVLYSKPFSIYNSVTLKTKAFKEGWLDSKVGVMDFIKVEGILKNYVLKTTPDNRYRHPKKLFDGIIGGINFRDGHWNGFIRTKDYVKGVNERNSGDLVLEIDLTDKKYSSIGFHSLESLGEYIMFPESIELYDISQNTNKLIYSKKLPKSSLGAPNVTKFFKVPILKTPSKVKLVVKSNKKLPKGHPAEGEFAWLFIDEVLFL